MIQESEFDKYLSQVIADEKRQHDILHSDPSKQCSGVAGGIAFNIGLAREEMRLKIDGDPSNFQKIYNITVNQCVDWNQAEELYNKKIAAKEAFTDKIDTSYNSRFPKQIKPAKTFIEFHKRRRKPSKAALAERATRYKSWKEAYDAINTEPAQSSDKV